MIKRLGTVCTAALLCGLALENAEAELLNDREGNTLAEIVEVKGDESFHPVEMENWLSASVTQPLIAGDDLRTGPYGGLALAFEDRTQIRLHSDSRMTIASTDQSDGGAVFNLGLGRIWSRASKPDRAITVNGPSATAAIRGTDWYMEVAEDGSSRLVVLDGEVRFFNEFGSVDVPAGASARAQIGSAPQLELIVETKDRPRWALIPRGDWIRLLPVDAVIDAAQKEASADVVKAWQLVDEGRFIAADEAAQGLPDSEWRRLLDAYAALGRGDHDAAMLALDAGYQQAELRRLASLLKVGVEIQRTDLTAAASKLDVDRQTWGEDESYLIMASWLEAYGGRYDAATQKAQRAAEIAPDDVNVALLLAQTALLDGDDERFGAEIARAQALAPDRDTVWHWTGFYRLLTGGDAGQGAKAAFEKAAELNPEASNAYVNIAGLVAMEGRFNEALALYDKALAIAPANSLAHAGKAQTYLMMDRLDLAEAVLTPALDVDPTNPELLSAEAVRVLLLGDPDAASDLAGKVIAASPDRPGSAELDAVSHWHAERRDVALKVIGNAVRLDGNAPGTAQIASIMSQDQYLAGQGIEYARKAWDARQRNQDAGLILLPASQNGRLDISSAFLNLGLSAQGNYYTSLAASPYDPNTAFGLGRQLGGSQAGVSSNALGLMLDPMSVSYPNRHAQFQLENRHEQTVGTNVSMGEDGAYGVSGYVDANGIFRPGANPVAYGGYLSVGQNDGALDNDASENVFLSLRAGTKMNGQNAFLFRSSFTQTETELPGAIFNPDPDDVDEKSNAVFELGYTRTNAWDDRWMFRITGAVSDRTFSNPSAPGATVSDLDYSLVNAFGLEGAQALAARGIYDTAFSDQDGYLFVLAPFGTVPVTEQLGLTLLPYMDDDDLTRRIEEDSNTLSIQSRRLKRYGDFDISYGLEYGRFESETDYTEAFFITTNFAGVVDLDAPDDFPIIETGLLRDVTYGQEVDSEDISAHLFARWNASRNLIIEGGVFFYDYDSEIRVPLIDLTSTTKQEEWDPRFGLSYRGDGFQFRFAHQTLRSLAGIDTIAQVGTVYLAPTSPGAVSFDSIESNLARLDLELTDRLFFSVEGELQDLELVGASFGNQRLEQNMFLVNEAEIQRLAVAANLIVTDNVGLSATLTTRDHEVSDGGVFDGQPLPLLSDVSASLGMSWVDPRFFRVDAGLGYDGEREGFLGGGYELDPTFTASASISKETRDKRWSFGAGLRGILNDTQEIAPGVEQSPITASLSLARRW